MALINCPECGKEISDKAESCPNCGCPISSERKHLSEQTTSSVKKPLGTKEIVTIIFVLICFIIGICVATGIISTSKKGASNQTGVSTSTSSSSYTNWTTSQNTRSSTSWKKDLEICDVYYGFESSYIVYKGYVKNNGKVTHKFVKVKGKFYDRNGKTVDTDWTYAVGSEGLRPGEKSSFRMSVPYFSDFMMADGTIFEAD